MSLVYHAWRLTCHQRSTKDQYRKPKFNTANQSFMPQTKVQYCKREGLTVEGINVGLLDIADAGDVNAADYAKKVACKVTVVTGPHWLHRPSRSHLDSQSL